VSIYVYTHPSRSLFLLMFIKGPSPPSPPTKNLKKYIYNTTCTYSIHDFLPESSSSSPPTPHTRTHTQTSTPQAGAAGLNDRHWTDGTALIHQATLECSASEGEGEGQGEAWAALLEWLVASPAVDVNARVGGVLMAG
jgi:hypothetical protein